MGKDNSVDQSLARISNLRQFDRKNKDVDLLYDDILLTVDIQRHSEGIEKAFLPLRGNFLKNLEAKNVFEIYGRYLLQYSKANAFSKGKVLEFVDFTISKGIAFEY